MSSESDEIEKKTSIETSVFLLIYRIPELDLKFVLDRKKVYSSEEDARMNIPESLQSLEVKICELNKNVVPLFDVRSHYVITRKLTEDETGTFKPIGERFESIEDAREKIKSLNSSFVELLGCHLIDYRHEFYVMKPSMMW